MIYLVLKPVFCFILGYVGAKLFLMIFRRKRIPLRDCDKDYLLVKTAIANVKTVENLQCMQEMVKNYSVVHGKSQQYIYLQWDLNDKLFQVLYCDN